MPYLRMTSASGQVLRVTPNHLLYQAASLPATAESNASAALFSTRRPVAAQDMQVGDTVFVQLPGEAAVTTSTLVSIERVMLPTAINVHTLRGNAVVDGIVTSNHCTAGDFLPANDIETVKRAGSAKFRMAFASAPWLLRRLHAWRLLTPIHFHVARIGKKADIAARTSPSAPRRLIGAAVSLLHNRVPAAIEAAFTRDATFPGTPFRAHDAASVPASGFEAHHCAAPHVGANAAVAAAASSSG